MDFYKGKGFIGWSKGFYLSMHGFIEAQYFLSLERGLLFLSELLLEHGFLFKHLLLNDYGFFQRMGFYLGKGFFSSMGY